MVFCLEKNKGKKWKPLLFEKHRNLSAIPALPGLPNYRLLSLMPAYREVSHTKEGAGF